MRGWFLVSGAALLALLFVFARTLLQSPTRTPLLIVSTSYDPPWDLNPCRIENTSVLESLDRHNLTVRTLDDANALAHGQWSEFEDAIAQLDHAAAKGKPLLIYLNLHGAVDENLRPCLLFRQSDPLDSNSWLPLQTLIDHVGNVLKNDRAIVLFLESGRQNGPFPSESPDNLFAVAVRRMVESHTASTKLNRLSVLVSTTANIASTDPCDGLADPFTRFLAEALAGNCDQRTHGGNGNHHVELGELNRYVQEHTKMFATRERGLTQSTMLCTSQNETIRIAWANASAPPKSNSVAHASTGQSISDMEAAWRSIYSLSKSAPWHDRPGQWAQLNQLAVGLEEFGFGGPDRSPQLSEFKQRFQLLESLLANNKPESDSDTQVKDLDLQMAESEFRIWRSLVETPSLQKAAELLSEFKPTDKTLWTTANPFLWQAVRQPELILWRQPDELKLFANASSQLALVRQESCTTPELKHIVERESQLDQDRRRIEDQLLADILNDNVKKEIRKFAKSAEALERWTAWFLTVLQAHDRAIADLTMLYRACDVVDAVQHGPSTTVATAPTLSSRIEQIANGLSLNIQVLKNASQMNEIPQSFVDVSSELNQLKQELASRWRDLVVAPDAMSPKSIFAVQELLRSGFLPNMGESLEKGIQLRLASRKLLSKASSQSSHSKKTKQERMLPGDQLELAHRSQVAIAGLLMDASQQTTTNKSRNSEAASPSAPSVNKLISIAREATQHDAVSGTAEDHAVAMSIARIVAGLCLDEDSSRVVQAWNALQCKRRLVRSSYRIMEDFWNEPRVRSEPFFVAAANELLGEASKDGSDDLSLQFSEAYQMLAARKDAASRGLLLEASGVANWRLDVEAAVGCEIKPGAGNAALPIGTASISLRSKNSLTKLGPSSTVLVGPASQVQTVSMNLPGPAGSQTDRDAPLIATLRFRGHSFASECELASNWKNISVSTIASPGFATVSVQDQRTKRRARTLILDCSASMIDKHYVEGANAIAATSAQAVMDMSKLAAARLAIADILHRWRGSPDLIGVTLFGHRVASGNATQGTLFQNRYYANFPFPQTLRPFEDVETILPVGRFSDAEFSAVMNRLDALLPWGQTPLYLAIQQAIEQTTQIGNGISHDVIVVSDGRNYQFNPTSDKNVSIDSVIQLARRFGVRIHVIGFGVPEAELQDATLQYRRLADESGGTATMQVANAVELIANIDKLTQPEVYSVRLATGESWQSPCNQPVTIPINLAENTPAWISYRNQQRLVPLSPRAAIRMNIGADERLVCAEYTEIGDARFTPILNSMSTPSLFQLGTYQPRMHDSGIVWHLSLQRTDGEVAQRPKYLWVEIDPIRENESTVNTSQDDRYYVTEPAWIPNTPIPVLQFITKRWPEEAKTGQLRFWCTDVPPKSLGGIEIRGVPQAVTAEDPNQQALQSGTLSTIDVRYQVHFEDGCVVLVFSHQSDATRPNSLVPVLELNGQSLQVERQYRTSQRMSIHRFVLPAGLQKDSSGRIVETLRFQVLDSNDIKRTGLQLSSPVDVLLKSNVAALPSSSPPVLRR